MLSYFLSLGNEWTNQSLKSSEFCGEKYGGFRRKWEVTVQEYRVSFWGDGNVVKLIITLFEYTEHYWIVHFNEWTVGYVNYILTKLW